MTRVLVVDDSRFMRTVVGDALVDAGYEVETAVDGEDALEQVASFDPDVVTMDVEMPGMDGIEAVDRIMSSDPTPILMLSAHTKRGAEATLEAIERGAVDVLRKPDPSRSETLTTLVDSVVENVEKLANADVSTLALAQTTAAVRRTQSGRVKRPASACVTDQESVEVTSPIETESFLEHPTIVLGASTGGPKLVEDLVARLPPALDAKLLIVQHMPPQFTSRFATRLDSVSDYAIREADDGDRIAGGEAVVAPGGYHLEVVANTAGQLDLQLSDAERVHGVRPAIDVTMQTAAEQVNDPLVGIVLSGMGRDGADGIEAIKAAGGYTFAQDERTSPVFGIPGSAIETGCVDEVVPADRIPDRLVDTFVTDGEIYG